MIAAVRNYCLRILPPKMSVPKATPFENKTLHENPFIFHLHREGVSDARHLLSLYCRHIYAPMTWVTFNNASPETLHSLCITSAKSTEFRKWTLRVSWFQTFAMFCMLYVFFWVIPRRLNFICRRFGTLCLFHLYRPMKM